MHTILYSTLLYSTILYSSLLDYAILYFTRPVLCVVHGEAATMHPEDERQRLRASVLGPIISIYSTSSHMYVYMYIYV